MSTHVAKGLLGVPRAVDEYPHELSPGGGGLPYKDTWMLCFHDHRADVTLSTHLTLSANRAPGLRATVGVQWGQRRFLQTVYGTPTVSADSVAGELYTLRIDEPEWSPAKRLRISLTCGDLTGEFEFAGRHHGANFTTLLPGLVPSGTGISELGHAEQAMTVTGRLTWNGESVDVDAPAFRDRSWGFRKSDQMSPMGYTWGQFHLPDASAGLLGWQHPDASSTDPLPVGAWVSDANGVYAVRDGLFHRSAEGRPAHLRLDTTDGRSFDLRATAATAEMMYPYHEPEMDGPAFGTICWDQHMAYETPDGPAVGIVNFGIPFNADLFRHSRFCHE